MNSAEEEYQVAQSALSDIEKTEQALFNETLQLTQEQTDELEKKVDDLEKLLKERLELLKEEEASIKKANKSIAGFEKILEKTNDENKKYLEELKLAVEKRYELHSVFVVEYKKLTDLQKQLYVMIPVKETELHDLQKKVKEVNEQNKIVQSAIDLFNKSTITVNGLKNENIGNPK